MDDPVPAFPTIGRDDTAFLQYTSGSTGQPRGVVLSHANVVDTVAFMAEAAQLTRDDVVVSWLPLYHDMGLIGCSFTPPWSGAPLYLLPPDLKNPRVWLELITRVKATVHGLAGLRLPELRAQHRRHGGPRPREPQAGPVRRRAGRARRTIEAFEEKFGVPNVITPCYGLAEATLAVAIWPRKTPAAPRQLGAVPLGGAALPRGLGAPSWTASSRSRPGVEAEICVKSPGVMQGYYKNPEATRRVLSR